jgi:SmpA / OmlA family
MEDRHSGKRRSSRTVPSRRRSSRRFKIGAWLLAIGGVLVIVLLVVVAVHTVSKHGSGPAAEPTGNRLTLENFRRLRYGMSYDQVVAIMGQPQFDDTTNNTQGKSRNLGWSNGRDTVSVQFFGDANKANVVSATFDRVNYNAPKP